MQRTSSVLNMVMTSVRAGARAVRSKQSLWHKALLFILPLISLFSLVVCPATSAFAAVEYPTTVTGTSTSIDYVTNSSFYIDDAVSFQDDIENDANGMLITAYSIMQFYVGVTYDNTDGGIVSGYVDVVVNHPAINISTMANNSRRVEVISVQSGDITNSYVMNTTAQNNTSSTVRIWVSRVNQRQNFGAWVTLKVLYSFRATATQAAAGYQTLLASTPTNTATAGTVNLGVQSIESFLPDLQKIREGLLDSSTGWLPTMNTNLQTMVTNQITANSWLQTMVTHQTQTNSHLAGVRANQSTQIANEQTMIARQNEIIDNQETQISQLQEIVDYINNTEAASVVDEANDSFTDQAAAMESGQAALEDDADDSIDAVDVAGNLAVVTTYRQSLNFWMRCVNYLPTATGSIWEAFVFGVFLAFILFILRLNK